MSLIKLSLQSLVYHWRTNLAVALGVMAATAVLTGALIVGDSVRGSLRHLIVDRLGRIDTILVTPRFFRAPLASEIANSQDFQKHFSEALPAILLQGTLESASGEAKHRAGNVNILGVGDEFWKLGQGGPSKPPQPGEIVLNQPLADELHVNRGDEIILRLPHAAEVPADSPLGRKTETVRSRRFTVSEIIPAAGLGRFGLRPSQQASLNAFTTIDPLQQMIDVAGRINAVLVAGHDVDRAAPEEFENLLQQSLHPTLDDYGLSIRKTDHDYFNLTTDRMVIEPAAESAAMKAFGPLDAQPAYTYLANYIIAGNGKIPYSTIAAVDFSNQPPWGPWSNLEGQPILPLADGEIVLNSWAADDLAAQGAPVKPGDTIEIVYFEPETTHGVVSETTHKFRLKGIVALKGPADDRNLTPEVKGVTDEDSIANWNPPFPYDASRVRSTPPNDQDDQYWKKYRATPKAFVSLNQGRKLWGSRFGKATSIRIPSREGITEKSLAEQLQKDLQPTAMGFDFLPIKRMGFEAATGTTPFAWLFIAFSFFIITAALMLVMLLFKLGIDSRAAELGIILATGWRRNTARKMYLLEGASVAKIGAIAGVILGIAYAWLMLAGLQTWWLGAITTPFLDLYIQPATLAIGYFSGLLISLLTIVWALRQLSKVSVQRLLAGQSLESQSLLPKRVRWPRWFALLSMVAALLCGLAATKLRDELQALTFLGSGTLVLTAILAEIWNRLRSDRAALFTERNIPLARLALRNSGRFPLRSTLTISLTATACFLIASLSAFQLAPSSQGPKLDSGDGGFALIARSDQPIYQNLNSEAARQELGFDESAEQRLSQAQTKISPLRVQSGDDASCLNLYQSTQPTILGVPTTLIDRGGFAWAAKPATEDPWQLISGLPVANENAIPVLLDQNTALYSLHLYGGVGEIFEIDSPHGGKLKLKVVGLLKNSIFQGDILMSETNFLRLFPDVSGYRMFLVDSSAQETEKVATALETNLGDYGLDTQTTSARLAQFFAVQNAYLATFRSLGGLGLLLGTFGLATVQLRNIVERRGELALFQAIGFRHTQLVQLVMLENIWLLVAGLTTGIIAALVVLLPHLLAGGAGIPWWSLAAMLLAVLIVGLLAGYTAVRMVLKSSPLPILRGV